MINDTHCTLHREKARNLMNRSASRILGLGAAAAVIGALGGFIASPSPALAVSTGAQNVISIDEVGSTYTGWASDDGELYWFDSGVMARHKEVYDPETDAWYWCDPDGTLAYSKDVYIPAHDKWVRYDESAHMVKGLQRTAKGAYYFDLITGEMMHGEHFLPLDGTGGYDWYHFDDITGIMDVDKDVYVPSNGGKWVRYDEDGKMVKGEDVRISPVDGKQHRWYFNTVTGEMLKGLQIIPDGEGGTKTVCYDATFGWMLFGTQVVNGVELEFDKVTGELIFDLPDNVTKKEAEILSIAKGKLGSEYRIAGMGPDEFSCDGFTYWVYNEAGYQLWESMADTSFNAQSKWLRDRGLLKTDKDELEPGDILFFGASWDNLRHAAIYLGVNEDTGVQEMIHAAGHYLNGVRVGVTISPLDADFLGGGSPLHVPVNPDSDPEPSANTEPPGDISTSPTE